MRCWLGSSGAFEAGSKVRDEIRGVFYSHRNAQQARADACP
jgi:hypothetical protein